MSKLTISFTFIAALIVTVASVQLELLSTGRHGPSSNDRRKRGIGSSPLTLQKLSSLASLGTASSFRQTTGMAVTNAMGNKRVRLLQIYAGYDVYGSSVEAEKDTFGYFSGQMYGEVARDLHKDIPDPQACMRDERDLFNTVIRMEGHSPANVTVARSEAVRLIFLDTQHHTGKLAYKIQFILHNKDIISQPVYFLDACTDVVLLHFNVMRTNENTNYVSDKTDIRHENLNPDKSATLTPCSPSAAGLGGNTKVGLRSYNTPPFCLNVKVEGEQCRMVGKYAMVVDNLNNYSYDNTKPIVFNCTEGYKDGINDAYGSASDVFYFAEKFGFLLESKYNFRILDTILRYVVHFGNLYSNAFYNLESFFFGDGGPLFYPFTGLDTVAHETAHAITFLYSGMPYRGQAGGMDEAFADISAEVLKHFVYGTNNWLHGWDIWKLKGALRFFVDPSDDGLSIKHTFSYKRGIDVHYSSGIFNHAFYRLVEEEGMNIYDAYKCFLDANILLWSPFTNFRKAACQVLQACYDNGFNHRKVRRAFFRVGIPLVFCHYSALATAIHVGESLKTVMVGTHRNPIFKAEVGISAKDTFTITATSKSESVRIDIARDDEARRIIATGYDSVSFDNDHSHVYVKLSLKSIVGSDVRVTLGFLPA